MITQDREYRSFPFERPEGDALIIEGYALKFDAPSERFVHSRLGPMQEVVRRGSIGPDTRMDDVVLNVNHAGTPIARTKNGTLKLTVDDIGLHVRADLSGTEKARQAYEEIRGGFLDKMSFAFKSRKPGGMLIDRKNRTRSVERIERIYDVAVVTDPAYEQTEVHARSLLEAEVNEALAEAERADRIRRIGIMAKT